MPLFVSIYGQMTFCKDATFKPAVAGDKAKKPEEKKPEEKKPQEKQA